MLIDKEKEKSSNIFLNDLKNYEIQTKNETTTLVQRREETKKYSVSVVTDKAITATASGAGYIVLNGILNDEGNENKFSLSFNEYYTNYLDSISIQVTNNQTKTLSKCYGTFLSGASSNYTYEIGIDISGESFLEFEEIILVSPFRKIRVQIKEHKTLPKTMGLKEIRKILKHLYKSKEEFLNN